MKGTGTSTITGGIFANDLRTNLVSCSGTKVLETNALGAITCGADASGSGTAAGTDGQVQYNDGGSTFGGASNLIYNDTLNYVGIGSSTPWGLLSIEQLAGQGSKKPSFVVGDNGTTTPFIFVSQKGGTSFGVASTSAQTGEVETTKTLFVGSRTTSGVLANNNIVITDVPNNSASQNATARLRIGNEISGGASYGTAIGVNFASTNCAITGTTACGLIDLQFDNTSRFKIIDTLGYYSGTEFGFGTTTPVLDGTGDVSIGNGNGKADLYISGGLGVNNATTQDGALEVGSTFYVSASGNVVLRALGACNGANTLDTDTNGIIVCGADASTGGTSAWTESAPKVYLATLTDYVGTGTSTPTLTSSGDLSIGGNANATADLYLTGGLGIGKATTADSGFQVRTALVKGVMDKPFFNLYNNNRIGIGTTTLGAAGHAMVNISATSSWSNTRRYGTLLADTVSQRFDYFEESFTQDWNATDPQADTVSHDQPYDWLGSDETVTTNGCQWSIVDDTAPGFFRQNAQSGGPSCLTYNNLTSGGSANVNAMFDADLNAIFETNMQVSAAANDDGEITVGLGTQTAGFANIPVGSGIYLTNCTDVSGTCGTTWTGVACNGSSCTFITSPRSSAVKINKFNRLRFEAHTGHVDFYVNDRYLGKVTATVPTASLGLNFNYTATTDNMDIDYVRIWQDSPDSVQVVEGLQKPPPDVEQLLQSRSDLAEWYLAKDGEEIEAGYLVSIATSSAVRLTTRTYENEVVGVISSSPGLKLSSLARVPGSVPVSLQGRVPVKVSLEGGPIREGDLLTSSSIPGIAMRARKIGKTIGMALKSFDGMDGEIMMKQLPDGTPIATGEVLMFVNLGWNHFDSELAEATNTEPWVIDIASGKVKSSFALDLDGQSIENVKSILSMSGKWSIDEEGNMIVKSITADDVKTNTLKVGNENTPTGVTLYDSIDGKPYCLKITNGSIVNIPGSCVDNAVEPLPPETSPPPEESPPPPPDPEVAPPPSEIISSPSDTTSTEESLPTTEQPIIEEPLAPPEEPQAPEIPAPPPQEQPVDSGTGAITQEPVPPPIDEPPQA